ncbi:DUF4276 family protein [Sansalvadorimonas verongulae]|uniref:DUF4276 family protein n=1 Tax=Sansalvadorimonas verongulae TaxID=2172824 RepID=UPI0022A72773
MQKKMYLSRPLKSQNPGRKGGDVRFSRVSKDLGNHLKQRKDTYVTTLIDYYGTREWPGLDGLAGALSPVQIAERLYEATRQAVDKQFLAQRSNERFIPFFAVHEFEALLFSDSAILANELNIDKGDVDAVVQGCSGPEAINNSPMTAPSKRLDDWSPYGKFAKTTVGITVAERIGISRMRERCPLFDNWLTRLEGTLD